VCVCVCGVLAFVVRVVCWCVLCVCDLTHTLVIQLQSGNFTS